MLDVHRSTPCASMRSTPVPEIGELSTILVVEIVHTVERVPLSQREGEEMWRVGLVDCTLESVDRVDCSLESVDCTLESVDMVDCSLESVDMVDCSLESVEGYNVGDPVSVLHSVCERWKIERTSSTFHHSTITLNLCVFFCCLSQLTELLVFLISGGVQ